MRESNVRTTENLSIGTRFALSRNRYTVGIGEILPFAGESHYITNLCQSQAIFAVEAVGWHDCTVIVSCLKLHNPIDAF